MNSVFLLAMQTKLIQFSLIIPINNRQREFNFRKRTATLYDGNTTDERGDRFYFTLEKETGQWQFGDDSLAPWLKNNMLPIVAAIEQVGL
ncbi:MAG TPA: hypothetical protein VF487_05520 [Chitinophagaceae bacterium]